MTKSLSILAVVFIVLKLTHVIAWSWWWVLSPLWILAIIASIVLTIIAILSEDYDSII